jgi:tetratricopeptide (TPR) repeat protein
MLSLSFFRLLPLLLALTLAFAGQAKANTLDEAQAAYQAGKFDEASELYLQVVKATGSNASVFHNLGLSFDRQKELGPAVAAYLRALQLQPRQGDFQYNLRFLMGQASDKLDTNFPRSPETAILLDQWTSERELLILTVVLFAIASALLSYAILRVRLRSAAIAVGVVFLLFSAYSGSSLLYKTKYAPDLGAVSSPKLEAYSGPTQSVVIFELHAGAPFQILETSGDWVKIGLSDQKTGWVRKDGISSFGSEHIILPSNLSSKS